MNPFAPSKYCFPCTVESSHHDGQASRDGHRSPDGYRGMSSAPGLLLPSADTLEIQDALFAQVLTANESY